VVVVGGPYFYDPFLTFPVLRPVGLGYPYPYLRRTAAIVLPPPMQHPSASKVKPECVGVCRRLLFFFFTSPAQWTFDGGLSHGSSSAR